MTDRGTVLRVAPAFLLLILCRAAPAQAQEAATGRSAPAASATASQDALGTLRFADWLLQKGDPYRAIGEYERFRFLAPSSPFDEVVRYRIALAYLVGEQYEMAGSLAARLSEDQAADPEVREAAWLLGGRALYGLKLYPAADAHLSEFLGQERRTPLARGWAAYQLAWVRLKAWDFQASLEPLAKVPPGTPWSDAAQAMRAELSRGVTVPYRSPVVAGLLSIVPGLGHFYLGQFGTGVSAMLWNGAFGWGLYETIRAQQWGLTVLLGLFEALWYTGTIFGAVAGAHRFNRDAKLNLLDDLARRYPPPGPPPQPDLPGAPPLSLSVGARF